MTVPVTKTTPVTNAHVEASRVLAAVALDMEADTRNIDSSKMPTIAENRVFLEPSGKRRKNEPAIYNKVDKLELAAAAASQVPEYVMLMAVILSWCSPESLRLDPSPCSASS